MSVASNAKAPMQGSKPESSTAAQDNNPQLAALKALAAKIDQGMINGNTIWAKNGKVDLASSRGPPGAANSTNSDGTTIQELSQKIASMSASSEAPSTPLQRSGTAQAQSSHAQNAQNATSTASHAINPSYANDFVPKAAAELPAYRKNYPPTTHEQTAESASRSQQKPADTTGYTKADGASHTGATNADDEREQSQAAAAVPQTSVAPPTSPAVRPANYHDSYANRGMYGGYGMGVNPYGMMAMNGLGLGGFPAPYQQQQGPPPYAGPAYSQPVPHPIPMPAMPLPPMPQPPMPPPQMQMQPMMGMNPYGNTISPFNNMMNRQPQYPQMPYYSQPQYQAPIIQQPVPQYRTSAPLVAPMLPAAQQPAPAAFNLADFRLRPPEVRLATAKPVRKEDDDEEESRGRTRRKKHKQPRRQRSPDSDDEDDFSPGSRRSTSRDEEPYQPFHTTRPFRPSRQHSPDFEHARRPYSYSPAATPRTFADEEDVPLQRPSSDKLRMSQMPQTPRNEAPEGSTFRGDDTPRPRSPVSTTNEPRASKAPADWDEQAEPNAYSDSWLPERPMRKPSAKATEAAGQQSPARPHSPHGVRWADVEDRSAKAPPEAASPTHSYGEPSTFDTMPGPSSVPYTPEPILSQEKPTQTDPAISKQHQSDLAMSKEDPYCPASYNAIPFAPYTRADSPRPTPLFSPLSDHHSDLDPASVFPSHYAHPDFQAHQVQVPEYQDFWARQQAADLESAYYGVSTPLEIYQHDYPAQHKSQQEAMALQQLADAQNSYQSYTHPGFRMDETIYEEPTDYNPYAPMVQQRMIQDYDHEGIDRAAAQNAELMRRGYDSTPEPEYDVAAQQLALQRYYPAYQQTDTASQFFSLDSEPGSEALSNAYGSLPCHASPYFATQSDQITHQPFSGYNKHLPPSDVEDWLPYQYQQQHMHAQDNNLDLQMRYDQVPHEQRSVYRASSDDGSEETTEEYASYVVQF